MKKDIHPRYKPLRVKIGNDVFNTMSSAPQEEILMDIDFRKHPAWTKKGMNTISDSDKNGSAFNKRFAGLSLGI